MEDLPQGQTLALTSENIALVKRMLDFDMPRVFNTANVSNNQDVRSSSFVFASDPKTEITSSPQRVFRLRAVVTTQSDLNRLSNLIRREEPKSAVRIVTITEGRLYGAVQYDPLDGTPNDKIAISS